MTDGETFTQRCRRMLEQYLPVYRISPGGLKVLFNDYGRDFLTDDQRKLEALSHSTEETVEISQGQLIVLVSASERRALESTSIRNRPSPANEEADGWFDISTVPDDLLEALLCWPAYKLDEDDCLTDEIADVPPLVARGVRHQAGYAWEGPQELEANGAYFNDEWEFGQPTHYQTLPPIPLVYTGGAR